MRSLFPSGGATSAVVRKQRLEYWCLWCRLLIQVNPSESELLLNDIHLVNLYYPIEELCGALLLELSHL